MHRLRALVRPRAPGLAAFLAALPVLPVLIAGCAGQVPATRPAPAATAAPPAASAVAPAEPPRPAPPPVPPPEPPAPAGPRLPWVNPARCLPVCAYDPSPRLVRVNPRGQRDARGRLQVLDEAEAPLRALLLAARQAGHALRIESAYRSYEEQVQLFERIKEAGRAARPGHSEHQLGAAIDLRLPTGAALDWLAANAADFGFALSYPPGKQRLTGYRPEPWHVRYVGPELAEELRRGGVSLEELLRAHPERGESGSCADCPHPASRAACGAVTAAGACEGPVLSWCYDGALASVDCSSSEQRCVDGDAARPADCAPLPAKAD